MTSTRQSQPESQRPSTGIALPAATLLTLFVLAAVSIFGCDTPGLRPNPPRSRLDVSNEAPRPQPLEAKAKASRNGKNRSGTTGPRRSGTTGQLRSGTTNPRRSGTTSPHRSGTTQPRRSGTTYPVRSSGR